jgi:tRNA G18 (ribose-2'-O)-methylase SpoU
MKSQTHVLLHNIRSVYNVGAIFRTADAVGVSKIYLSGYTPTSLDRFGRERKDFAKCALGAEKTVPWEYIESPIKLIKKSKIKGFKIIAVEQSEKSVDYKKVKLTNKTLVILGNEVEGVENEILKLSDTIAEIPMRGLKESLNVSVSAGIVLFRWMDRNS